jgi:hypothetical protein
LWKFEESQPLLKGYLRAYPKGKHVAIAKKHLGMIDPAWEVDENGLITYDDKFKDDVRLKKTLQSLPKDLEDGFARLEKRVGLDLRPHTHVLILLEDTWPKIKGGLKASTYIVGRKNVPTTVTKFFTEFIARSPLGYRETRAPRTEARGLLGDDALAFEWLEKKKSGNVKTFCQHLVKGRPYQEILSKLTGTTYEKAIAEADDYCRKRVNEALSKGYPAFVKLRKESEAALGAQKASEKWLEDGGQAAFESWLEENEENPAAPMARFCLARTLAIAREDDAAR